MGTQLAGCSQAGCCSHLQLLAASSLVWLVGGRVPRAAGRHLKLGERTKRKDKENKGCPSLGWWGGREGERWSQHMRVGESRKGEQAGAG
eukprot:1138600-Pelagomonas_calceolata.AAC.11